MVRASSWLTTSLRSRRSYPIGSVPPIQIPLRLEAATLSRMRSPITSRSNCANESSTLSVRRPIEVVVELLGDGDERRCLGVKQLDHLGKVGERAGQPVHLVDLCL